MAYCPFFAGVWRGERISFFPLEYKRWHVCDLDESGVSALCKVYRRQTWDYDVNRSKEREREAYICWKKDEVVVEYGDEEERVVK